MGNTTDDARVLAYSRVSTAEQADSRLGLDAQRADLDREAKRRGWTDVAHVADDGHSCKSLARPGITAALDRLSRGNADVLLVSKLYRLSRSVLDFATLMERARLEGWEVVVLDLGVDTSTPSGRLMANVVASAAQYERELIGSRTRDALKALKARGQRLGRPVTLAEEIRSRIAAERAQGRSLRAVADDLTAEGVSTAQGGKRWYASTVKSVLDSLDRDAEVAG